MLEGNSARRTAPARCCGSPRTSAPRPSAGSAPRSAATASGENALADQLEEQLPARHAQPGRTARLLLHARLDTSSPAPARAGLADQERRRKSVPLRDPQDPSRRVRAGHAARSDGMRTRRRRDTQNPQAGRLPDALARLVTFTVTAATRRRQDQDHGDAGADHPPQPSRSTRPGKSPSCMPEVQMEIAFLHLRADRPRSPPAARRVPELARQEPGRCCRPQRRRHRCRPRRRTRRARPGLIPFTAVLGLIRAHVAAGRPAGTATPPRQPAGQPEHRDPRPAPPPPRAPANIRQPPPNDAPGTPKKSPTPSTSQSRISRNGTAVHIMAVMWSFT